MKDSLLSLAPRPRRYSSTALADVCELSGAPSCWERALPADYAAHMKKVRRKWWEWEYLAESARASGMLDGKKRALGLAVGSEPLIFYFANQCDHVLATDLYSSDTSWNEASFDGPAAVRQTSPIPFAGDRLQIANMDMRALDVPDSSVDFIWSTSSLEHVPTLIDLLQVYREVARVLRPGGYAFLTTEFSIIENDYLLPGLLAMDERLLPSLIDSMTAFESVGSCDLRYNWAHPGNAPTPRRYRPVHTRPDLIRPRLYDFEGGEQIALMMGQTAVAPVGFTLRRREGGTVPELTELGLENHVVEYTQVAHFNQQWKFGDDPAVALDWAERATELLALDPERLSLQFRSLVFRQYIEALSRATSSNRRQIMMPSLEWGIDLLGHCAVADADCFDIVAHFLMEFGEFERCAELSQTLAWSPSTIRLQVVKLGARTYNALRRAGRTDEGLERFAELLADIASTGAFYPFPDEPAPNGPAIVVLKRWIEQEVDESVASQVLERVERIVRARSPDFENLFSPAACGCRLDGQPA